VGNRQFRDSVTNSLRAYMDADNRFEKSMVVHRIVDNIHSAGGRFLKKDYSSSQWFELSDQQAKEKVGHAIRDAVNAYESKVKGKQQKGKDLSPGGKPFHQDLDYTDRSLVAQHTMSLRDSYLTHYPINIPLQQTADRPSFPYLSSQPQSFQLPQSQPAMKAAHQNYSMKHRRMLDALPVEVIFDEASSKNVSSTRVKPSTDDGHDEFVARINAVLGPLPQDANDPMEPLLDKQYHGRDRRL
jgi:hypothetical protein